MALENKAQKAKREALEALPRIVQATLEEGGLGYTFCTREVVAYLAKNGLAEANDAIVNEHDAVATRATLLGIESTPKNNELPAPAEIKVAEPKPERKLKMSFVIENIPVVAGKRGGGTRTAKYPFDAMEVGQSFFVATDKSIASALTNAMKKYDVPLLDEAGNQLTKNITVPKTGEKRTIPATKHVRIFKAVAEANEGVAGFRVGRTA